MKVISFEKKQKESVKTKEDKMLNDISEELADIMNKHIGHIDYELLLLFIHSMVFKLSSQLIMQLSEEDALSLYNKIISVVFTELTELESHVKK